MGWTEKRWSRVSVHAMVLAFLRAEQAKLSLARYQVQNAEALFADDHKIIETPKLDNPLENQRRLRLLMLLRGPLLGEIPPDTEWYRVETLQEADFETIQAIGRCGGDDPADSNELRLVAKRRPCPHLKPPSVWEPPILWGHAQEGPFVILEGNNRLIGYASETGEKEKLDLSVIVGLSPSPCYFALFDPPCIYANDMWDLSGDAERLGVGPLTPVP